MKIRILIVALLATVSAKAQVKLLPIFTDNMVLQQQSQAPIWGEAKAGKTVVVTTSWDKLSYQSTADKQGRWSVKVATPKAGGPYSITISDGKAVVLKNVMIGEVWICTGQSNMEMPLRGGKGWQVKNHDEEVAAAAQHPNMRLIKIDRNTNTAPLSSVTAERGGWQVCSPESAEKFSATGYFFGRELEKYQNVPIGLIMDCWGGTVAEAWTSGDALSKMPYFAGQVERLRKLPESAEERQKLYTKEVDECETVFDKMIYTLKHMDVLQRMPWLAQNAVFQKLAHNIDYGVVGVVGCLADGNIAEVVKFKFFDRRGECIKILTYAVHCCGAPLVAYGAAVLAHAHDGKG